MNPATDGFDRRRGYESSVPSPDVRDAISSPRMAPSALESWPPIGLRVAVIGFEQRWS